MTKTLFTCTHCDAQYAKWIGRCLECGKWESIEKMQQSEINMRSAEKVSTPAKTKLLQEINTENQRVETNIAEIDRVLGGGFVQGSFVLLSGEPGIGKSTLALQIATAKESALYISGEESITQVGLRATRLQLNTKTLRLANETSVEAIVSTIRKEKPSLAIVDSIQTIYTQQAAGGPGSVSQIRACSTTLLEAAKAANTTIIIIGHVTKDGAVAGPRTLEHLVDAVLYLEGDRYQNLRILRGIKNRFGSTDEIGMFEMTESGLKEVANPSATLLEERGDNMPGSVVTCLMEGTRPLLVEVQALVNKTSFGYPVRKASGFDLNRLHVLIAVLEKRAGLSLGQYDVHVNIVGGIRAQEPAADLAVAIAIASAFKDKALGNDLCVFGEVGLGGEIRSVRYGERRIKECSALGMKRVVTRGADNTSTDVHIMRVKNIKEILNVSA
jgi:DNA repair protein RadA/Sms